MASIQKLKRRIKTAKNIAQTTKAMELVAASRMRKAQQQALENRPYSEKLLKVSRGLLGKVKVKEGSKLEQYFNIPKEERKTLIIMVTSDKGLAGALISNFARKLLQFVKSENKTVPDYDYLVYGKKGRDIVVRLGGTIIAQFDMGMTQPKYEVVPPAVRLFDEGYVERKYTRVLMFYTDFINTLSQVPKIIQILPLKRHLEEKYEEEAEGKIKDYLFEPNPEVVLNSLLPRYFENQVYHALLESYASEQSARMAAMKNATDNANDIISELTMFYNKERQQVITSEIADIITATLSVE